MTRGERLKELRNKIDRTLEEVGQTVNISKQNLYKYENDIITNIPSDKIEALASYYMVTPAYLMGWEVERVEKGYNAKDEDGEYYAELRDVTKEASDQEIIEIIKYAKYLLKEHEKK